MWELNIVVLNAHMKFRDNLPKFILHTIFFTRWEARQGISATVAPFPTPLFSTKLKLQW